MMKNSQEQFNKILSLLNVNVFELMDLTLETFGHHLIHENGVQGCKKNIDDLALSQKKELYSKLSPLFASSLSTDNYIEYREVFRFASSLHCSLPYDHLRTEEHSAYFDKLACFDYRQFDPDSQEDERYKIRGYEKYYISSRDAFDAIYSNSEAWHNIKGRSSHGIYESDQPLITQCPLSVCDYITNKSLEEYFRSELRKIENDLVEGDYHRNMSLQLEDIFISEAFDQDFLIHSFIGLFLSDYPGKINWFTCIKLEDYWDESNPMQVFFESEIFTNNLRERLSRGLILDCRNTKRFIKENITVLNNLYIFDSVLSQYEAMATDDLDREINHMADKSDIYEQLSNFDAALMVANESFRLQRLAKEKPKDALKQRKQFIDRLCSRFHDPVEENWPNYQLRNRLYNYFVLQNNLEHVYADKRSRIPEFSSDSREPYDLLISDKEAEFSDDQMVDIDTVEFIKIFEIIQKFIKEQNKGIYEVWH